MLYICNLYFEMEQPDGVFISGTGNLRYIPVVITDPLKCAHFECDARHGNADCA